MWWGQLSLFGVGENQPYPMKHWSGVGGGAGTEVLNTNIEGERSQLCL